MALSPQATTYTIPMGTTTITIPTILSVCPRSSTGPSIGRNEVRGQALQRLSPSSREYERKPANGIVRKPDERGIENTPRKSLGNLPSTLLKPVQSVENISNRGDLGRLRAPLSAGGCTIQPGSQNSKSQNLRFVFVKLADLSLTEGQTLSTVPSSAERRIMPVYDIHVEDQHEFFANGVLVHNCLSYAKLNHIHVGGLNMDFGAILSSSGKSSTVF